jgi:hypothetical protein
VLVGVELLRRDGESRRVDAEVGAEPIDQRMAARAGLPDDRLHERPKRGAEAGR